MSLYQDYTTKLKHVCRLRALPLNFKRLSDGYRFPYLKLGNPANQRRVCFSAGIHGDEAAGPYAALRFLENFDSLPEDVSVLLMPLVNPYGFDREQRHNGLRQDINRRFCDQLLAGEAKAAYSLVSDFGPKLLVTLHEWGGKDGYYMYASDRDREKAYKKIPKIAAKRFKVFNDEWINREKAVRGIIWHPEEPYQDTRSKCTLENRIYMEGAHYTCIETPSQADIEDRVQVQYDIMKYVLQNLI